MKLSFLPSKLADRITCMRGLNQTFQTNIKQSERFLFHPQPEYLLFWAVFRCVTNLRSVIPRERFRLDHDHFLSHSSYFLKQPIIRHHADWATYISSHCFSRAASAQRRLTVSADNVCAYMQPENVPRLLDNVWRNRVAKLFLFFITHPYFLLLPVYLTTVLLLSNTYHISFRDLKTCYWVSVNNGGAKSDCRLLC